MNRSIKSALVLLAFAFAARAQVTPPPVSVTAHGQQVIFLGDSITGYCGLPGESRLLGYCDWALGLGGLRASMLSNAGVGGDTTALMLARLDASVLALRPDIVIVQGGINDISATVSTAVTIANLKAIYTRVLAQGAQVIAMTITPASFMNNTPTATRWVTVNDWIRDYARRTTGITLADAATAYLDPAASFPVPTSGYTFDGTHPSPKGAVALGSVLGAALDTLVPAIDVIGNYYNSDPGNFLTNGYMTGTGGSLSGATGQTANSWTGVKTSDATCSMSKVSRTDGLPGAWQSINVTVAASHYSSGCYVQQIASGWSIGDTVYLQIEFLGTAAIDTIWGPQLIAWNSGFSNLLTAFAMDSQFNYNSAGDLPGKIIMRTANFTIPSSTAYLVAQIGLAGVGTAQVGRVEIRKVPTP